MKISQLVKLSGRLFIFKAKPQDFPESLALLLGLLVISFIGQAIVNVCTLDVVEEFLTSEEFSELMHGHSTARSIFMIIFGEFFTLAFMQVVLTHLQLSSRLLQASSSLFVVQIGVIVLSIIFFLLTYPLKELADTYGVLWGIFLLMSVVWSFRMFTYIFVETFDCKTFHAVLWVLLYSLLQGWLGQVVSHLLF